jgi:hypothetical protein
LTNWLYRELMDAVTGPEVKTLRTLYHSPSFPLALEGWRSLVADKHRWDFKHRIRQEFRSEIVLFRKSDHTPYDAEYSIPGNIFYGYVGSAIGFEGWLLHAGAGYAEGTDPAHAGDEHILPFTVCGKPFYFNPQWIGTLNDDPDDYRAAGFGIQLWNQHRETMTESQFVRELEQNHHQFAPPPIEYGGNAYGWRNPKGTWPYPVGYFNGSKPSWLFD